MASANDRSFSKRTSRASAADAARRGALYAILDTLRDTYGVTSLQTFMCSSVAARFDNPPARVGLSGGAV